MPFCPQQLCDGVFLFSKVGIEVRDPNSPKKAQAEEKQQNDGGGGEGEVVDARELLLMVARRRADLMDQEARMKKTKHEFFKQEKNVLKTITKSRKAMQVITPILHFSRIFI